MDEFIEGIREGLKEFSELSAEDEKNWGKWLVFKGRRWLDLYEIIGGNFDVAFKKRAILILMVPSYDWLPFDWYGPDEKDKVWCDGKFIANLNSELIDYTAKLIMEFSEIIMDFGGPEKFGAIRFYNDRIIDLLPLLSDEKAQELFDSFRFKEVISSEEFRWPRSAYFYRFLSSNSIDDKWKKLIDEQMRQFIEDFKASQDFSGEKLGELVNYYAEASISAHSDLSGSPDLIAVQIQYILDNVGILDYQFSNLCPNKIYKLLSEEKYRELRLGIARYKFPYKEDDKCLSIRSKDYLELAEIIVLEFREIDPDLVNILIPAIRNGYAYINSEKQKELERGKQDEEILATMANKE